MTAYSHPYAKLHVKEWHAHIQQLDDQFAAVEVLQRLTCSLVPEIRHGDLLLGRAQMRKLTLGQIPTDVLNQLDSIDWLAGDHNMVAHRQIIWRFYLLFEYRSLLKSLTEELAELRRVSIEVQQSILSELRARQSSIYLAAERQGNNPRLLDELLDQEVDLVEWLLEVRLWHQISLVHNRRRLRSMGIYDWWAAEKKQVATITSEPRKPLGDTGVIQNDLRVLNHAAFNTRLRFMVLMAGVGMSHEVSVNALATFLGATVATEAIDGNDAERLVTAFYIASRLVSPGKFERASAIVQRVSSL